MIREIKMAAKAHDLFFTEHAVQAMLDDGENEESVSMPSRTLRTSLSNLMARGGCIGDGLTAIVAVRPGVIVVTIFV